MRVVLNGRVQPSGSFATFVFCVNVTSGCVESSSRVAKWVKSKTRTRLANYKVFNYLQIKDLGRIKHHCAFPTQRTMNADEADGFLDVPVAFPFPALRRNMSRAAACYSVR